MKELQQTQMQLIHSEKMSSLGQLVTGIVPEINNPVNFIYGNLNYLEEYVQGLLNIVQTFQQTSSVSGVGDLNGLKLKHFI